MYELLKKKYSSSLCWTLHVFIVVSVDFQQNVPPIFWWAIFIYSILKGWFNFNLSFDGLELTMTCKNDSLIEKKDIEFEDYLKNSKHVIWQTTTLPCSFQHHQLFISFLESCTYIQNVECHQCWKTNDEKCIIKENKNTR